MSIDDVIELLNEATEGSAELDLLCMKALGDAPEKAVVVGGMPGFGPGGDWRLDCPSTPCTCKGDHLGGIIPRTRSLDATESLAGIDEWTGMIQQKWPETPGWTVVIGGSILISTSSVNPNDSKIDIYPVLGHQIVGVHKSLPIARTIAVLRAHQRRG